jgi:hypothetical protein
MRFERLLAIVVLAIAVVPLSAGLLWSHHSVAGYDTQKEVVLHGVVKEFNWRNPHVYVVWEVKDQSGKVVEWAGEMNSPTSMIQVGMNRNSLKPGDEVVITVNPSKTSNPLGIIRKITMADGRLIVDRFTPQ